MATVSNYLDRCFDPLISVMTTDQARQILEIQPDPQLVARVKHLAEKADAGTITVEERDEYKHFVDAGDIISLLKAKARRSLNGRAE
jgi:hypothetical protein